MKFNAYFLIVGLFSILFSLTHAWNGHATLLPLIDASNFEAATRATVFYIWHIISAENLIFGVAFVAMAFYKDTTRVQFAAWIIAIILLARWGVILGATLLKNPGEIGSTLVDSVAIGVIILLIILGIRKKKLPGSYGQVSDRP